jgi:hypothetical protein
MIHEPVDLPGASTKYASHPEDRVGRFIYLNAIPAHGGQDLFFVNIKARLFFFTFGFHAGGNVGSGLGCGYYCMESGQD